MGVPPTRPPSVALVQPPPDSQTFFATYAVAASSFRGTPIRPPSPRRIRSAEVAAAGGWEDESVVLSIYQQIDEETMYQVVANPRKLREVNDD